MLEMEREVINAAARKSGLSVLDLLQYLKSVVSKGADRDADALQADSDSAAADVEVGVRGNDVDFVANVVDEDVGGDEDDWEDEDDRPARGDLPQFLPRAPPSDKWKSIPYRGPHQWFPLLTSSMVYMRR